MIKAHHTWFGKQVFDWLVPFLIRRHFRDFIIEEQPAIDHEKPVLILANHFSWWDGFTHYYLNQRHFHKRFHVMMLEEELAKRPLFSRAGAYGVKKGRRYVLETLDYTVELLADPDNMVLIFPAGRIQSLYDRECRFQKGLGKILEKTGTDVQVIFSYIFPEYGSHPKPALHGYFRLYDEKDFKLEALEAAFAKHFRDALLKHQRQFENSR